MQDLRDKLLKAGLVDKKQARESKTEKRRQQRQSGSERGQEALEAQRERHQQRVDEQARRARLAQEEQNRKEQARQDLARVRTIIRSHAVTRFLGDDRPFHFLGPDRRIRRCHLRFEVFDQLLMGQLAIVSVDDDPRRDYALVDIEAARRLEALAPDRLLFWNKPGEGQDDLPPRGSGERP